MALVDMLLYWHALEVVVQKGLVAQRDNAVEASLVAVGDLEVVLDRSLREGDLAFPFCSVGVEGRVYHYAQVILDAPLAIAALRARAVRARLAIENMIGDGGGVGVARRCVRPCPLYPPIRD